MARKQIQGITIEIGGDTTKLSDALKGVESKLKETQAALRDTNRLLKLDPGNVELLSQKQRQLTDAIEGTEEKLRTLKEAAADADRQLADGTMSQAQYDALQREIADTEQSLRGLKDEMRDFGSVSAQQLAAAGEKVKALGDKMTQAGTALTKYVTGPIVAVGAASVAAFNEVDEGLDIIVKKTGATGEALEDMEEAAKNLATSIPTDFRTAGEAVGEVNTRFGLTGQALEELSGKFIKFAQLNDTSVTASIDNVQAAMAAFDVETESAGDVLDILNKAAQNTGVDINKLSGDLTANATSLREMGFGLNTATGFLASLNKNGVDASSVMTGLKTALKNATKDGQSMEQALYSLTAKIKGAKSETKAMQLATELFGGKAAPALTKAIREGRLSFDELANAIQDYGDSVDGTFEATLDPVDEFKTTLNELKIVGMELVQSAAPLIKSLAEGLRNAVSGLRSAWEGLSPQMQQTIIKMAGIAAAVGPVLTVGGKLVSGIGTLMTLAPKLVSAFSAVKGAFAAVSAVLAANPVGAVIAGVVALGAALVTLYNKCEWFRNAVNSVFEGIKRIVSATVEGIKTLVNRAGEALQQTVNEKFERIKAAYKEHGGGMEGIAAGMWEAIKARYTFAFDFLNNLTGGKLDGIKQMFANLKDSALNWGRDLVTNFINGIKGMWENAKRVVSDFAGMIKRFLGFSEPEEGPLSDFHTYAPDMVKLFTQGLKDNEGLVKDQLARTFGLPQPEAAAAGAGSAVTEYATPVNGARPIDITFVVDGAARWAYRATQAESQRVGIELAET